VMTIKGVKSWSVPDLRITLPVASISSIGRCASVAVITVVEVSVSWIYSQFCNPHSSGLEVVKLFPYSNWNLFFKKIHTCAPKSTLIYVQHLTKYFEFAYGIQTRKFYNLHAWSHVTSLDFAMSSNEVM
jgi:hypothetical protein